MLIMQLRYVKEKSANSAKWWHFVASVNIFSRGTSNEFIEFYSTRLSLKSALAPWNLMVQGTSEHCLTNSSNIREVFVGVKRL